MYLLDTVAVSALMKPGSAPAVEAWLAAVDLDLLHVPAPVLGEIWRGIARLPDAARRTRLREAFQAHVAPLLASCPAFDAEAAAIWGGLMGAGDAAGRQLPILDAQIAAVAVANGLTVVTRNVRDFAPMGVATFNPWDAGAA